MTITFYRTSSEANRIDKSLTTLGSTELLVGYGNKNLDKINPTVRIKVNIDSFQKLCNYAYIDEFERYYFVQSINIVDGGLYELTMHVDVLTTYKTPIGSSVGKLTRSTGGDDYLTDGSRQLSTQKEHHLVYWNNGNPVFNTSNFDTLIITYGGGGYGLIRMED